MDFIYDGLQTYVIPIVVGLAIVLLVIDVGGKALKGDYKDDGKAEGGEGTFAGVKYKQLFNDLWSGSMGVIIGGTILWIILWFVRGVSEATGANIGI